MVRVSKPPPRRPPANWPAAFITDISEAVYRVRLGGSDEAAAMIEKDKDNGVKLRNRAKGYDSMTRDYLTVLKELGMLD